MKLNSAYFLLLWCLAVPAYAQIDSSVTTPDTVQTVKQPSETTLSIDTKDASANDIESTHTETETTYEPAQMFAPDFINNLFNCTADTQTDYDLKIIGKKHGRCHLKYANFDLFIPSSLLENIHSVEDIETLLKNKDIAHYNYKADYLYEGLTYALDACLKKKDFDGKQEELADDYVVINRGLTAEFANNFCTINLINQQNIEGVTTDYGVVCRLPYKVVQGLESYFKDLVDKYGEKRGFGADGHVVIENATYNEDLQKADDAFMYYLQQNNFCTKNNDL